MKVTILSQYYLPEIGAPQARLSSLVDRLIEKGHEVFVMTSIPSYPQGKFYDGYGGLFMQEKLKGATVFRVWTFPTRSTRKIPKLINYLSFALSALFGGLLKLPKSDFLISESPPLTIGLTAFLLSKKTKAKWIFNVSDLWPESAVELGYMSNSLLLKLAYKFEGWCYQRAFAISGQSQEIISNIRSRYPSVLTYHLSNGVDCESFSSSHIPAPSKESINTKSQCIFIYGGLHGIAQGLEQILEAAHRLHEYNRAKFVLVGDGPEKTKLVQKAKNLKLRNVQFLDPCNHQKMVEYLKSSQMAIISLKKSLKGAVPSKIYEAMAAGLPILYIGGGEARSIIQENQVGVAVEPGNIDNLVCQIKNYAESKKLRESCSEQGLIAAQTLYNRKQIGDSFIRYLEGIIK